MARSIKRGIVMEKWEYLFARFDFKGANIASIGNTKLPKGSEFEATVRLLGEDGWELVLTQMATGGGMVIFKRTWTDNSYDVQSLTSKLEAMPH